MNSARALLRYRAIAVLFLFLVVGSHQLNGAERIALLVGNNVYPEDGLFPSLDNAENDVKLVAAALQQRGFETIIITNADRAQIRMKLAEFESKIEPGGTALFYFAGHGIQYEGENYLMGSNARLQKKYELADEAIRAQVVLDAMVEKRPKSSFVFLDCCRTHPPKSWLKNDTRSALTQGLASMEAQGMVIAYSALPGQAAADGDGDNSPFASALAENILKQYEFDRILKEVGKYVYDATNAEQQTWRSGSLLHDFYFTPESNTIAGTGPRQNNVPQTDAPSSPENLPEGDAMPTSTQNSQAIIGNQLAPDNVENVIDFAATEPLVLPSSGHFTTETVFESGPYEGYNWYAKKSILKKAQGALPGAGGADGVMGKKTQSALIEFQTENSLPVTGRLDQITLSKLELSGIEEVSAPVKSSSRSYSGRSSSRSNYKSNQLLRDIETAGRIYRAFR